MTYFRILLSIILKKKKNTNFDVNFNAINFTCTFLRIALKHYQDALG